MSTQDSGDSFKNVCGFLGAAAGFVLALGDNAEFGAVVGAAFFGGVIGIVVGHVVTVVVRVIIALLLFGLTVLRIMALLGRVSDAAVPTSQYVPEPAPAGSVASLDITSTDNTTL